MQAIILAAGMGKRLGSLTAENTKCMVQVDGVPLIKRALEQLDALNLKQIIIVVGYKKDSLIEYIEKLSLETPVIFLENPIYDKTNNIYSLYLARDFLLLDDTLLLESDLIFEREVLQSLINDPRPTLAVVDKYESWMDGTVVTLDSSDAITSFTPGKNLQFSDVAQYYKTVNIYKFSKEFSTSQYVPFLEAYTSAMGRNEYYEQVLRIVVTLEDSELRALRLSGQLWYEIDDIQDLDIAESLFAQTDEKQLSLMEDRYGGYWRYPRLLDFCYLVNTYYPSERMVDEMKASFETLLRQYPSGSRVNNLLAGKYFDVSSDYILVGNGAAELIKALMDTISGNIGITRPTFEEYPNRYSDERTITFAPNNENYAYTVDDLVAFFDDKTIEVLVLINPDNPSGNYIGYADIHKLATWCEGRGIRLVLDESFADFAEEENNSFLNDALLEMYPHLTVVKSISKCYGVPGLRLGVLASSNTELVAEIRKETPIWNINSFAEFYLQIAGKYKDEYAAALRSFFDTREVFAQELEGVPNLRMVPSQANYFMIELQNGVSATCLTKRLLCEHSILVKDLTKKMGKQYIRIAIRDREDNHKLVQAMKAIFSS